LAEAALAGERARLLELGVGHVDADHAAPRAGMEGGDVRLLGDLAVHVLDARLEVAGVEL
jgi:hypothetical protein